MDSSRIRLARKAAEMTQEELAEHIGVNRATVSKYETGEIAPSIEMLGYIANAVDCDIEYLLGYNEKMRPTAEDIVLFDAIKQRDARTVERLMGLKRGTIISIGEGYASTPKANQITFNATPDPEWAQLYSKIKSGTASDEEQQSFAKLLRQSLEKSRAAIDELKDKLSEIIYTLNAEGQQKVLEFAADLAEVPKYQRLQGPDEGKQTK